MLDSKRERARRSTGDGSGKSRYVRNVPTIVLLSYLAIVAWRVTLEWLNLRHRQRVGCQVPEELAESVGLDTLAKSASYSSDRASFGLVRLILSATAVVLFLFAGGLSNYDAWVAATHLPQLWQGVAFFVGLHVAGSVLELPLDAYATLRIEQRHGFNRSTTRLFLADWIKGLVLSVILLIVISVAGLSLMALAPRWYWFWVWGFAIALAVLLMLIAPTVIEPLFIKTEPLQNPQLTDAVQQLAERAGVQVSHVLKVDASRRTTHSNAYFTGIGRVKRVVLFDTLLERLTIDELLAVLGHELGHWKLRHVTWRLGTTAVVSLGMLYIAAQALAWQEFPSLFGLDAATVAARVVMLAFLASILGFLVTPISAAWSRRHERQADDFAARTTRQSGALASALVKLARDNLSNLHPHPFYAAFYYSHPPTVERVRRLREQADCA